MTAARSLRVAPPNLLSSRDNAAIVRAVYAAFSGLAQSGEVDSYVAAHFDPDCEYRPVEEASTFRGRRSGMEVSQRLFDVFELRDGRVLRITEYLDPDQALEAAGLRE